VTRRWIVSALVATTSLAAIVLTPAAAAATAECSWVSGVGTHVTEGDSGTVTATIRLACTNQTGNTYSIHFTTDDGTAVSPGDYVATSGDIPVPPGASNPAIALEIVGDTRPEASELLGIALTDPTGSIAASSSFVEIDDNDGFTVSSISTSAPEGDTGTKPVEIEVRLSDPLDHPFTVSAYTEDLSATAGVDYAFTNENLRFDPGEVSKRFQIVVIGDTQDEPDELVFIAVAITGTSTLSSGRLTILDDDEPASGPCLLLSDTSVSVSGTASTPATRQFASPDHRLTVTNCGDAGTHIDVRGTNATGSGATWQLTNASSGGPIDSTCDLGPNIFRVDVTLWLPSGGGIGTPLTTQDTPLLGADGATPFSLPASATQEFSPEIELPCAGSDNLGDPMTMTIDLTAVTP
jgi:hypothetical protein